MQQYINLNGSWVFAEEPVLSHKNRGFQYGDALFETMHANGTQVQLFSRHMERLIRAMGMLKMEVPPRISNHSILQDITKLLHKNRHLKGARVRLTVFRNQGGKYTPATNACSYLIESEQLEYDTYRLNSKGLIIGVFDEIRKPVNPLANLKTTNDLVYVLAGIHKSQNNLDECLIMNPEGEVIEAISSNVFAARDSVLHTPPLASGCLDGVMRKQVIELAREAGWEVKDSNPLWLEDLMHADEVFLTNAVRGIQWVGGIRQKRYFKQCAKELTTKLNQKTAID